MLNLFVTSRCNLRCDYCFVSDDFQGELERPAFSRLLAWLKEAGAPALAILGGEPTLHPDLLYHLVSLSNAGVGPVLFTNALFPDGWAEPLAALALNIVVNYNGPEMYSPEAWARRERNVGALADFGAKMAFSKNFAPGHLESDYLIEGAKRFGVKTIRYDLSKPREGGSNAHFGGSGAKGGAKETANESAREGARAIAAFARKASEAGLETGLDCCLPPCLFEEGDLEALRRLSSPFEGTCRPSLDILPDLSVLHCWPLKCLSLPDATAFESELGILERMANLALPLRERARKGCGGCGLPPSRCQGGCLAGSLGHSKGAEAFPAAEAGKAPGARSRQARQARRP